MCRVCSLSALFSQNNLGNKYWYYKKNSCFSQRITLKTAVVAKKNTLPCYHSLKKKKWLTFRSFVAERYLANTTWMNELIDIDVLYYMFVYA